MINAKWIVTALVVLATASLTGCPTSGTPSAAVGALTATVTATSSMTPTPTPSTAVSTVRVPVVEVTRTVHPKVVTQTVVQQQQPPVQRYYQGNPGYYGSSYGTYALTGFAYPGPIHSYSSPTDTSSFVETIPATSLVTVYCMVRGQPLQGADMWDWDGSGWIWDEMVDMNGGNPPGC